MATRSRAQIGAANARKGKDAERRVATYLRDHGFPHAERAVRTGYNTGARTSDDPGDVTGTPGISWQVKSAQDERLEDWMDETEDQRAATGAHIGVLVVRRSGKADPARWWVYLDIDSVGVLLERRMSVLFQAPVRMELGDAVRLLRQSGFGDPLPQEGQLDDLEVSA